MRHLAGRAFLDWDLAHAVAEPPVDRRRGQRDVERHAVVIRGQRLEVGADLVGNIAGSRRPIRADDDHVDLAMLHQVAAGIVGDHGMRHAVAAEFIGRQGRALVAGPRLVDPDMDRDAGVVRDIDRGQRRTPVDGGKPARIAVGQDVDRMTGRFSRRDRADQRQAVLADGAAERHVLVADQRRLGIGGLRARPGLQPRQPAAHARQRPVQVHGGGRVAPRSASAASNPASDGSVRIASATP